MDEIPLDPIVQYYLKLSTENEDLSFKEIRLRLALTQLLGRNHVFCNADIKLYEKVFLLYYTRKGFTVDQVVTIMATCFDAATVRAHLTAENRELIINEWRQFQQQNLIDVVYKDAAIEMLKEWHYRCTLQQPDAKFDLSLNAVQRQMENIFEFLLWDMKHRQKFVTSMWRFLKDETTAKRPHINGKAKVTPVSLDCASLFESVKSQLSPWLVSMVKRKVRQCANTVRTTLPVEQIVQLKRLPEGTTVELESSAQKKCKISLHSKKRIIVEVEEPTELEPAPAAEDGLLLECREETTSSPTVKAEPIDNDCDITKYENVIDLATAMAYIEQLKTYALAKECFEALDPLEQVETCFNSAANG